jgi:hypothetical protein
MKVEEMRLRTLHAGIPARDASTSGIANAMMTKKKIARESFLMIIFQEIFPLSIL